MGLVSRLLGREERALSERDWLRGAWLGLNASASGRDVTPGTALTLTTVYAAVDILARSISTLPLITYQRLSPRGKQRATTHPYYVALHLRPNPWMTRVELWQALVGHLALRGNAYVNRVPMNDGTVELWPLRPDRMTVEPGANGEPVYRYRVKGEERRLGRSEVIHFRTLSGDGLVGYSPVALAREAIGLGLATEEFGARLFANNARPGGVLQVAGKLSDDGAKRLAKSWNDAHQGLENSHRVAVLEEGVSWQKIGLAANEAQFLETRKYQANEIARIWHIPPHLLGDLDRATFANIEHQSLDFVTHTLRPWLVLIEQRLIVDLFLAQGDNEHFAEHLVDGLLRGDLKSRYDAYAVGRNWGWLSINDVREKENLNPIEGPEGDDYLVPLNMTPADKIDELPAPTTIPGPRSLREARAASPVEPGAEHRREIVEQHAEAFLDAAERVVRREAKEVLAAAEKHLARRAAADFAAWLRDYYDQQPVTTRKAWAPSIRTLAKAIYADAAAEVDGPAFDDEDRAAVDGLLDVLTRDYAERSHGQLAALLEQAIVENQDPFAAVSERLDGWREARPAKVATRWGQQTNNAMAYQGYRRAGVQKVVWRAFGESCPYCTRMHGKVVEIDQVFLQPGDDLDDGEGGTFRAKRRFRHPPLHGFCDCGISPA